MKKLKLNGKLSLNKETISKLNDNQMKNVKAGGFLSLGHVCTLGFKCATKHTNGIFCNDDTMHPF